MITNDDLDDISNYLDRTIENLDKEACELFDLKVLQKRIENKLQAINKVCDSSDSDDIKKAAELRRSRNSDILTFQRKSMEYIRRNDEHPIEPLIRDSYENRNPTI